MKPTILTLAICITAPLVSSAAVIISEVHSSGSDAAYEADWFELTNTSVSDINIAGWKVDDSSNSFASSAALQGVTLITPGQSVIFAEVGGTRTAEGVMNSFKAAWFGAAVPSTFVMGTYSGAALGLSGTNGDAINIFNSTGLIQAQVTFGAATVGRSFDNAAGTTGAISTLSTAGVNGAFTSVTGNEIGSPGAIPEPSTALVFLSGMAMLGLRRQRRAA